MEAGPRVCEEDTCLENNGGFISNYGERYRRDERISLGLVGSTLNQEAKVLREELS
jgi:hypothetical protein